MIVSTGRRSPRGHHPTQTGPEDRDTQPIFTGTLSGSRSGVDLVVTGLAAVLACVSICASILSCAGYPADGHTDGDPGSRDYECRAMGSYLSDSEDSAAGFFGFFPVRATVKQRIILDAAGSQYDLIGYLVYRRTPTPAYRAVTFAEIGGAVFDLLFTDAGMFLVGIPQGFPENPLLEGVMPDIRLAFGIGPPLSDGTLCRAEDGSEARLTAGNGGAAVTVLYSDFRASEGVSHPVPHTIHITNRRWAYTVEVTILEITPEIRTENAFDVP